MFSMKFAGYAFFVFEFCHHRRKIRRHPSGIVLRWWACKRASQHHKGEKSPNCKMPRLIPSRNIKTYRKHWAGKIHNSPCLVCKYGHCIEKFLRETHIFLSERSLTSRYLTSLVLLEVFRSSCLDPSIVQCDQSIYHNLFFSGTEHMLLNLQITKDSCRRETSMVLYLIV